ncbi:unnamed protein product, partial [Polarella glacialis]
VRNVVNDEVGRTFGDFVYNDNLFQWESRSSYTGRARPTPKTSLTSRLTRFLTSQFHSSIFAHLDLGTAPIETLQDRKFHKAITKMPRLEDVVFPQHGWAGQAERTKFLSALPPGASAWGRGRP